MRSDDQHAQDTRVERLWRTLDTQNEGHLDIRGLRKGLKQIDHRLSPIPRSLAALTMLLALKNADDMLQDVLAAVDTDGDGRIQYAGTIYPYLQCTIR